MRNFKFGRGYVEKELTFMEKVREYEEEQRKRYWEIIGRRANTQPDPGIVYVPFIPLMVSQPLIFNPPLI